MRCAAAAWHNDSLFLRDDGLLFGCFEAAESFRVSLDGMAQEEVNLRWQALMQPYCEAIDGRPDQSKIALDEVFRLD